MVRTSMEVRLRSTYFRLLRRSRSARRCLLTLVSHFITTYLYLIYMMSQLTNPMIQSPLHLLAHVALGFSEKFNSAGTPVQDFPEKTGPATYPIAPSPTRSLHIPCGYSAFTHDDPKPLRRSSTSNSLHADSSSSSSGRSARISKKHTRKVARPLQTAKADLKARRRKCMERALRIKSLENSPVNDRQLHVLRMVYDEITMYPSEAWMVLIAIVINRCVAIGNCAHKIL